MCLPDIDFHIGIILCQYFTDVIALLSGLYQPVTEKKSTDSLHCFFGCNTTHPLIPWMRVLSFIFFFLSNITITHSHIIVPFVIFFPAWDSQTLESASCIWPWSEKWSVIFSSKNCFDCVLAFLFPGSPKTYRGYILKFCFIGPSCTLCYSPSLQPLWALVLIFDTDCFPSIYI